MLFAFSLLRQYFKSPHSESTTVSKMHCVKLHKRIDQINSSFYRLWDHPDKTAAKDRLKTILILIFYALFSMSFMVGAITSDDKNEFIFLLEATVITVVELIRICYAIRKKNEFIDLLSKIGVFNVETQEDFTLANNKLNRFMKFATFFLNYVFITSLFAVLLPPFVGNEKKLFFNIAFPLDHKNDEISFWVALAFLGTEIFLTTNAFSVNVTIWYLLLNCGIRYEVLGNRFRNLGVKQFKKRMSKSEKQHLFAADLTTAIKAHQYEKQ